MSFGVDKIILVSVIMLIMPILIGNSVCGILKRPMKLSQSYLFGNVSMWAFCQLITVPLVFVKADFRLVMVILCAAYIGVVIWGLWKRWFCIRYIPVIRDRKEMIAFVCLVLFCMLLLFLETVLQHTDADDSRFVVNAVDIVRTNRMFLTHPGTGERLDLWMGELTRDVVSPWAVYMAFLSRVTGVHVTVMAHTVLPVFLLSMVYCVYWLLSEDIYGDDVVSRCIMIIFVLLLNVYGYYSLFCAETFMLTRIWQGKAVVASVGVPCYLMLFLWIYKVDQVKPDTFVLLTLLQFSMSLLSGMGILIGITMTGCFGLIYGIIKKNIRMSLGMWLTMIPNLIYCGISFCM